MLDWLFGRKKQQSQEQKNKKTKKATQAEDKWMYDFMLQFLSSPIWRVSILDFVDNKCVVFDNEEQNKFEYTIIHNEFKQLVANLVDGMMQEIGMDQEKLAQIIQQGLQSKQKKLFNQLLLADDFLRFKDLMVKRNKSLEQEAIKALQESQLKLPNQQQKSHNYNNQQQLLRQSKRIQEERKRKLQQQQEEMLRKAIQMSKLDSKQFQAIRNLQQKAIDRVKEEPKQQQKIQQQFLKDTQKKQKISKLESLKGSQTSKSQISQLPPLKGTLNKNRNQQQFVQKIKEKTQNPKELQKQQQKQVKQQVKQVSPSVQHQSEQKMQTESMEDRKQRLLAQREKIRKQKQEQRKKQLEEQEEDKLKQSRPTVQTVVLQEEGFFESNQDKKENLGEIKTVSEDELRRRKQLMNKIKNRIIDDF